MKTETSKDQNVLRLALPWWFLPAFIVVGQMLMRVTGYTAWAAQAGQEFMLSLMFYMSLLGPILAGFLYVSVRKSLERKNME